jgi:hypothetical protein
MQHREVLCDEIDSPWFQLNCCTSRRFGLFRIARSSAHVRRPGKMTTVCGLCRARTGLRIACDCAEMMTNSNTQFEQQYFDVKCYALY